MILYILKKISYYFIKNLNFENNYENLFKLN